MLLPGDPAPTFKAASSVNPSFAFDTVAGRHVVLSFLASSELPFSARLLEEVGRRRERFDANRAVFFGVSIDPADRERLAQEWPGIMYFWDLDLAVSRRYEVVGEAGGPARGESRRPRPEEGAPEGTAPEGRRVEGGGAAPEPAPAPSAVASGGQADSDGKAGSDGEAAAGGERSRSYAPCTFVLDQALRVAAVLPFAGDPAAHVERVMAALDELAGLDEPAAPAPVLMVPRVFEPDLCRELIAYYEAHGGEDSGFMRDVGGRTVAVLDHAHKRRSDCEVKDGRLIAATQERLARRVVPAVRQAFCFHATRIERHIVACYDAAGGGHFRAHRDNTTRATAHRRFAVTINLNAEEFEGGELWFPEFSVRRYKATTGGCVVFSCSLLHEATPVTVGRRYAFLPFLYDEAAARVREQNRQYLAEGPAIRGSANAR